MEELGDIIYYGRGVPKDVNKGMEWKIKAARLGDSSAQSSIINLHLGSMTDKGLSDFLSSTFPYIKEIAEDSEGKQSRSMYRLALCYEHGYGVEVDYEKAVYWYNKAAGAGYSEKWCKYNMAQLYKDGKGYDGKKYDIFEEWWTAANNDYKFGVNAEAGKSVLKPCLETKNYKTNTDIAIYYYRQAADKGHAEAEVALKRLGYDFKRANKFNI